MQIILRFLCCQLCAMKTALKETVVSLKDITGVQEKQKVLHKKAEKD